MKAAVCRRFGEPLVVEELELAAPRKGEVRVRVAACAICHSDIHYMDGAWGGVLPAVFGHEAAGVVEEVGHGVARFAVGDHVLVTLLRSCGSCFHCTRGEPHLCDGEFALDRDSRLRDAGGASVQQGLRTAAFAEQVVVDQSQLAALPADMEKDAASLLACGVITGVGAVVNTARVEVGSSVVVIGTGGVGLNSVQGAALAGANPVIAVDVVAAKLDAARAFGATDTLDAGDPDIVGAVRALTRGRGADYVFVTVGSAAAIEQGVGMLRRAGTVVLVGMPAVGVKLAIEAIDIADGEQRVIGSKMGSTRLATDIPRLVDLYRGGRLKLDELITARYPLEQINAAIAEVRRGSALRNVIVF